MNRKQTQPRSATRKWAHEHFEHLSVYETPTSDALCGLPVLAESLDTVFKKKWKFLVSRQWIFKEENREGCFSKRVFRKPKTRLTKTVSGNLLLIVWKAEYELVNTKKDKVGEGVRRHGDIETNLHAHTVWSHIGPEICRLQSRFTVSVLDCGTVLLI